MRIITLWIIFLVSLSLIFQSCFEDKCEATVTYAAYTPVYKKPEELIPKISFEASRDIKNPGKIYFFQQYILINEAKEGVHIVDNTNATSPKKLGFISIPGNLDIAMRDHYIYADDEYNLVVIDIADFANPKMVCYIPGLKDYWYYEPEKGYLVGYTSTNQLISYPCNGSRSDEFWQDQVLYRNTSLGAPTAGQGTNDISTSAPSKGGGGSLARVAFVEDYFYYADVYKLHIFDAKTLAKPVLVNKLVLPYGIETLFPYKDKLFLGANDGMHIYNNQDSTNPKFISTYAHIRACDPVVVQDDIAYVTLRNGTTCQNFSNQLDVVDIKNLEKPQLISSFNMTHPIGLSIVDNILYLCDDKDGLKVFDTKDKKALDQNQLAHLKNHQATDVINVSASHLLMIGSDGFVQYDCSDPKNLKLLSIIPITK